MAIAPSLVVGLGGCSGGDSQSGSTQSGSTSQSASTASSMASTGSGHASIESTLNLANNENQEWTYSTDADAWVLSIVSAVAYPELPDQQGVSVCVPGAYVTGIDTNGDGTADVTSNDAQAAVKGSLVIDFAAQITSPNGQVYTAATAPVILNTGAAGYGSQNNSPASTTYAADGYINVACGNRGKQDTATDSSGATYHTGDAPSCLVDQKNAARFVKYNILLGNLPGSVDYVVSTGGSGGATHATMFAATDSATYASYDDMVAAYKADIAGIEAGDEYGNNIVSLYNPLNYIGAEGTEDPVWTRIVMGASEGDISMFASLNLEIAWFNAGVDAVIEWQWDGGHVPSEVLGDSFSLYVDEMYGTYVDGAKTVTKSAATPQTTNGTETEATGVDISNLVDATDLSHVSFTLADAAAYRTAGASKSIPGFDVIDCGQEDYVFGNSEADARHWDTFVLEALEKHADVLEPLFNTD